MTSEARNHLLHVAAEAASAPAVKASAAGSGIVVSLDWMTSGPGLIALAGLSFTALTFAVNVWSVLRRERRAEQERREAAAINAAKLARLQAGMPLPAGVDSDRMGLES